MTDHETAVIEAKALGTHFVQPIGIVSALMGRKPAVARVLEGVNLKINKRKIVGLVGESGSGKSTLGMTLVRMYEPSAGEIAFMGKPVTRANGKELKSFRAKAQIIFQDPYSSLNPRLTVGQIVEEPLKIHAIGRPSEWIEKVKRALEHVRMPAADYLDRFPSDLSGGQRQRVAIARALVLEPEFIVADEPVSMLDVSVQAGVLELLDDLSRRLGLGVLYISHDIATVGIICDEIAVMYAGQIIEQGPTQAILQAPRHPYSEKLVAAIPRVASDTPRQRVELPGEVPSPLRISSGCRFASRCRLVSEECRSKMPELTQSDDGRLLRCHLRS